MGNILTTEDRIKHFEEFHKKADYSSQTCQASRCMSCGVPFCQAGMMISGMASGCPLNNLVPETNELVASGNYEQAYIRISKTHPFPEFTSRVCPALCEAACTQGHCEDNPVPTKENEGAIIDYAYEHDLVKEPAPKVRRVLLLLAQALQVFLQLSTLTEEDIRLLYMKEMTESEVFLDTVFLI